jgi:ABC-type lipoprotein export system ATPase subunit
MGGTLLELRDVVHAYDGPAVLDGLSLSVAAGGHVLIEGPSGAGKTTLLNVAGALLVPQGGTVVFDGQNLATVGDRAGHRLRNLGFVFQEFHLLESLSARHNVGLVQAARGGTPAHTVDALLGPLGLDGRLDAPVRLLSRGERQRVALARAFANSPRLILADEPTASLDPSRADATLTHLFELAQARSATVLMVSHDRALRERPEFSQRLTMDGGRIHQAS